MFGHRFIAGSWSAFAAVTVIVIAVVANLIVNSLPASTTQIDIVHLDDEVCVDPFPPFHEQGCSKGRCVLECFKPNEVLITKHLSRIESNFFENGFIRSITYFLLYKN